MIFVFRNKWHLTFKRFGLKHATKVTGYNGTPNYRMQNIRMCDFFTRISDAYMVIDSSYMRHVCWFDIAIGYSTRSWHLNLDLWHLAHRTKMFHRRLLRSHLSPLTLTVVWAAPITLQQYLSTIPCLPLPSGNLQTPFLSIPWCYIPISSSFFVSFLLLSLPLAELFSPCQRILRCGHSICVSVYLDHSNCFHLRQIRK